MKTKPNKPKQGVLTAIERGEIANLSKKKVPYEIIHGWDAKSSVRCDALWAAAWLDLFEQIERAEPDQTKQEQILESISTEDMHWRWFGEAIEFSSDEYEWFHLHANGMPQAACLIYHPKASALETGDIFYVEFVAVAPWNRPCDIRPREFGGLGEIILRAAQRFAVTNLKLRPGFGLHSLPKAERFYTKLNMVKIPGKMKDSMNYFELPQLLAVKLMEAC